MQKCKSFWKILNKIFEFVTQVFENLTKKPMMPKKIKAFEKKFDAKNSLLGPKLLLADDFWPKIKVKTLVLRFWKLSPVLSPHVEPKDMIVRFFTFSSEPERFGKVNSDEITWKKYIASLM